ncbi:hypothetical protein ACIOHS_27400 [Streptomyces sp. NPDC088253]|uniref:hypothetical protein n=1 Tax=Streptomyces sp. NPDC088253 TaxID=3365846 RepID=UPI00382D9100
MPDQPARYYVTLRQDGEKVGVEFAWRELPTPGLLFEHDSRKYRVQEVCVLMPPAEDEEPKAVECDVVEAYRWDRTDGRWMAVVH